MVSVLPLAASFLPPLSPSGERGERRDPGDDTSVSISAETALRGKLSRLLSALCVNRYNLPCLEEQTSLPQMKEIQHANNALAGRGLHHARRSASGLLGHER